MYLNSHFYSCLYTDICGTLTANINKIAQFLCVLEYIQKREETCALMGLRKSMEQMRSDLDVLEKSRIQTSAHK